MPPRLSPTERLRAEIDELVATGQPLAEILERLARLSVRLVFQTALEVEVTEFLGRDRYQRAADPKASAVRPGYRNGHQPLTIKTTSGRSPWSGPSCAAPMSRLPRGCWARA